MSDGERSQNAPVVEKDAGAEILLWRVHVVDELLGDNRSFQRVFYHYIRMKIFDDKGKEKATTIDLPYREPGGILDISGRTIKADGSIVELDRKTVYKRDVLRAGGRKERVVSFAMPGVEQGAILEYRWKQTQDDNRFRYVRLNFQREFPVQKVVYFVKPLSDARVISEELFIAPFNCMTSPIKRENDGYASTFVESVAAKREESFSPSEPNVEPWALLYYRKSVPKNSDKFWEDEGRRYYKDLKEVLKVDEEMKAAVAKAIAGVSNDNDKISALLVTLHKSVRGLFDPDVSVAEREKFIEKLPGRLRTSTEIFKSGMATPDEMNVLFNALATQAGMDVRPALVADRTELFFNPKLVETYFLRNDAVAIKQGSTWRVIDAGRKLVSPGMLPWQEEGMFALITDPKTPAFIQTPMTPPEGSLESRKAQLSLSAAGTLEGDVTESITGHRAEEFRFELTDKSPAQREEWLKDRVTRMFPDADVASIKIENVDDATKALSLQYHLSAENFAQVTGKRILFQPVAFHRGSGNPFTAAQRRNPVEFPFGWSESDDLHIKLPDGFSLDNADSPGPLSFGKPGSYEIAITITKGAETQLNVSRRLTFGKEGVTYFDAAAYPSLKKIFDAVQVRDRHTLSLKGN